MVEHFRYLLGTIPSEHVYMIDHIEFAIKRRKEFFFKSPLFAVMLVHLDYNTNNPQEVRCLDAFRLFVFGSNAT